MTSPTKPRKRPKQERAKATVDAILTATAQVLVNGGYEQLTTARIAERAGVSVGSLYQYFPSKDAMLLALLDRNLSQIASRLDMALASTEGQPITVRMTAVIRRMLEIKAQQPSLTLHLAQHMTRLNKSDMVRQYASGAQQRIEALIQEHADEVHVADRFLAAWLVVNAVSGLIDAACAQPPRPLDDPALVTGITQVALGHLGVTFTEPTGPTDLRPLRGEDPTPLRPLDDGR